MSLRLSFHSFAFASVAFALALGACSPNDGTDPPGGAAGSGGTGGVVEAGSDAADAPLDTAADTQAEAGDASPDADAAHDVYVEPECAAATDCPGTDGDCQTRACREGTCAMDYIADGTALPAQTPSDCLRVVCDGAGATRSVPDDADLADDALECTVDTCSGGTIVHTPRDVGTACTQGGGKHCDATAACVECTTGSQCGSLVCGDDAKCASPTCADGVKNQDEADVDCGGAVCGRCALGKTCKVAGDCTLGFCTKDTVSGSLFCTEACGITCGAACLPSTCGDGACSLSETCGTCPADCGACVAGCGDGVVDAAAGEECDDGNMNAADFCTTSCTFATVKVNTGAASALQQASARVLGDATIAFAWSEQAGASYDVALRRFTAAGRPIDAASFTANATTANDQLAVGVVDVGDGSFDALWLTGSSVKNLVGRRFLNNCTGSSPMTGDTLLSGTSFYPLDVASVTVGATSTGLLVAWTSGAIAAPTDASGTAALVQRFKLLGGLVDPDLSQLNQATPGDQNVHGAALLQGGSTVVVWTDSAADGNGTAVRARLVGADGQPTGSDLALNAVTTGDQRDPVVAALPGGGFVAAWTDASSGSKNAVFRRFDAAGAPVDASEQGAAAVTAGYQVPTSIAANAAGHVAIVWSDGAGCESSCSSDDVRARVFDTVGRPLSAADLVPGGSTAGYQGGGRVVALATGDFLVTFLSGAGSTGASVNLYASAVSGRGCGDLDVDMANCGACGTACAPGGACTSGTCVCPGAVPLVCGGVCADLEVDTANCGGCGNKCSTGATCMSQTCICLPMPTGLGCHGVCVDTALDAQNCGACDNVCSETSDTCTASVCGCGAGSPCTGGQVCTAGSCGCPSGLTPCGGACVDTTSDALNCGDCGVGCTQTSDTCTASVCTCGAAPACDVGVTCSGSFCQVP